MCELNTCLVAKPPLTKPPFVNSRWCASRDAGRAACAKHTCRVVGCCSRQSYHDVYKVCIHVYVYMCICVCIYIYIYIYREREIVYTLDCNGPMIILPRVGLNQHQTLECQHSQSEELEHGKSSAEQSQIADKLSTEGLTKPQTRASIGCLGNRDERCVQGVARTSSSFSKSDKAVCCGSPSRRVPTAVRVRRNADSTQLGMDC